MGLNSADFKNHSNNCSFQTMHLTSQDSFIPRMIENAKHGDLVKGCFMFDIINNVRATKLPIIDDAINRLKKKPDADFNLSQTEFDLESIEPIELYDVKNYISTEMKLKKMSIINVLTS
ncbi:hypothetical protein [Apilactobacillus timberlakei]|uniref:hypothetical protein n=1 Tax=Apilactobacillus timberlakei TaxID=2008380 RepID=UPI00112E8CBB|nr:hypothetical protein [Apilactobacillus timberlakei]